MSQTEKKTLASLHASAVQSVENILNTPPGQRNQVIDESERAIVRLRDALIEQFRQELEGSEKETLQAALNQVNVAVSLIAGVEYPGSGAQEKPIRQSLEVLTGTHL